MTVLHRVCHVLRVVLSRVLYLRQKHGPVVRIVLSRIAEKEACRQIPEDPGGAPVFGYRVGNLAVVDLRLQFGWSHSTDFSGLFSAVLEHAQHFSMLWCLPKEPRRSITLHSCHRGGGQGEGWGFCRTS